MRKLFTVILLLFIFSPGYAYAQSQYVLPYPSSMPGSKFYVVQELKNDFMRYWYFGNFGQFTYNLNQADKFLVEAKTLFEYKQYLLAHKALKKSDDFFTKAPKYLEEASKENKDISQKKKILKDASLKHIEVLNDLKKIVPESFTWKPEKSSSTILNIGKDLDKAVEIRKGEL